MFEKPPLWADVLLTLWAFTVGLIYFGGYFSINSVGIWTERASLFYALMLLLSISFPALRGKLARKTSDIEPRTGAAAPASRQENGVHSREAQGDPDICQPK